MKLLTTSPVSFAFDIGHASIGWAVKAEDPGLPAGGGIIGCGVLIFPRDDCQNHARAALRRQRRHVAATRNRVKRLRKLFLDMGVISEADEKAQREAASGVMMPWLLAAQALHGKRLNWAELWQVIRWYAHNRGYDGNAAWARDEEESDEDTEKVRNANALMEKHGAETMAETMCADLGVDLEGKSRPMQKYFKGENVAFPRSVIVAEVNRILVAQAHLEGCDETFRALLMEDLSDTDKRRFRLPERFHGGLLFGQMIPRFDNRIIPVCPITGEKTPLKNCREYLRFRWGMLLANIRVETPAGDRRALTPQERGHLHALMEDKGHFIKKELKEAVTEISGCSTKPMDNLFFTPETEKALVLDPIRKELNTEKLRPIFQALPDRERKVFANQLRKKGRATLKHWREQLPKEALSAFDEGVDVALEAARKRRRKKAPLTREEFLAAPIRPASDTSGRAPYCKKLLRKAFEEAMQGMHPGAKAEAQPETATERHDGCIARTEKALERERKRELDELTNNHLVRHRIRMFRRLLQELYDHYAGGDIERIRHTTIEVARDLVEFSGMDAKSKAALFSQKAKPFQDAEKELQKRFDEAGMSQRITYSLIRKARIAIAQDWTCPYTGRCFGPQELTNGLVDIDHIIPRSKRPSDSLDNLVVSYSEANKRKENRLPLELIAQSGGDAVSIRSNAENGQIVRESRFRKFVESLPPKRDPRSLNFARDEDFIRWRRKQNLLLEHYDERDADFTPGALTVTSHLNKLAALEARKFYHREVRKATMPDGGSPEHRVGHVQGSITHYFQTRWRLLECLGAVCPEVIEKTEFDSRLLPKAEIRNITHLHHAVDAIALSLVRSRFPVLEKKICEAILRRKPRPEEKMMLEATGLFFWDNKGRHHPKPVNDATRESIVEALGEKRVVQHVPADMGGMVTEQTQWRVLEVDESGKAPKALIEQYGPRDPKTHKRSKKQTKENPKRLLGYAPKLKPGKVSKLKPRQAAIIINGNFGIALTPEPQVIPFHKVWKRLECITQKNDGKRPEILRAGQIIYVAKEGNYHGLWRIHSVKDNTTGVSVDMARPHLVKAQNKQEGCKMNVLVASLLKAGMKVKPTSLAGN